MADQPGRDFFIGYTAVNRPWAEWIAVQLEAAGYSTVLQDCGWLAVVASRHGREKLCSDSAAS